MGQHDQTYLSTRPPQAPTAEAPQLAVLLPVRIHQLHTLAPQPVQGLGLRAGHALPQRLDLVLMLRAADRPARLGVGRATRCQWATPTVRRRAAVLLQQHRLGPGTLLPAGALVLQPMPRRAGIRLRRRLPLKSALGDLLLGLLALHRQ